MFNTVVSSSTSFFLFSSFVKDFQNSHSTEPTTTTTTTTSLPSAKTKLKCTFKINHGGARAKQFDSPSKRIKHENNLAKDCTRKEAR